MIERYIDQIITMEILADVITILDDKGIIRYYKPLRYEASVFSPNDIVGRHFMEVFPFIKKDESTVMKALKGMPTLYQPCKMLDYKGDEYEILECVYPIKMNENIIGAVCISRRLDKSLKSLNLQIPSNIKKGYTIADIIGISPSIQNLKMKIMQVAETDINVLICGETGTGKEMVAESIHALSKRKNNLFYAQNCAALPGALLESLMFGTKKGVYTGAIDRSGILEQTSGGSVFLDEINSLDLSIQAKLLKVIEEKKFRRLGGEKEVAADFRIIAATNEDPFVAMETGKIRSDLFYRLSSIIIEIPPLRERKEDIPILADYFLKQYNEKNYQQPQMLSKEVLDFFMEYDWPGNVRELRNIIESSLVFSGTKVIGMDNLPSYLFKEENMRTHQSYREDINNNSITVTKEHNFIHEIVNKSTNYKDAMGQVEEILLREYIKKVPNRTHLAKQLNISRQSLIGKLRKYNIK